MNVSIDQPDINQQGKSLFDLMSDMEHEQVVQCYDKATGLKAIIAIHSTTLGPSMGGTRMWHYPSEQEALLDALRLSRGMTYKSAISGLNVGGGKAVLIGDPRKLKNEIYLRRFGKFINSLGGKYVTACDVNISPADLAHVKTETSYVTGLPEGMGGSGSSSLITAYGTYMGIKAAAQEAYGNDSLKSKRIVIQGVGSVGMKLAEYVSQEGAKVFVNDIDESRVLEACQKYGAEAISHNQVYDLDADIYAPCALGATLNSQTIPLLKYDIIAGAANNQLKSEKIHGDMLLERGILYAPDFLVNAGGIMAVAAEYQGSYQKAYLYQKAEHIYHTCLQILKRSKAEHVNTQQIALMIAKERIEAVGQLRKTW